MPSSPKRPCSSRPSGASPPSPASGHRSRPSTSTSRGDDTSANPTWPDDVGAVAPRRAGTGLNGSGEHPSVRADWQRIMDVVRGGFDRGRTRGVVIVACVARTSSSRWSSCRWRSTTAWSSTTRRPSGQLERMVGTTSRSACCWPTASGRGCSSSSWASCSSVGEVVEPLAHGDAGHHDRGDLAARRGGGDASHLRRAADRAWQRVPGAPVRPSRRRGARRRHGGAGGDAAPVPPRAVRRPDPGRPRRQRRRGPRAEVAEVERRVERSREAAAGRPAPPGGGRRAARVDRPGPTLAGAQRAAGRAARRLRGLCRGGLAVPGLRGPRRRRAALAASTAAGWSASTTSSRTPSTPPSDRAAGSTSASATPTST